MRQEPVIFIHTKTQFLCPLWFQLLPVIRLNFAYVNEYDFALKLFSIIININYFLSLFRPYLHKTPWKPKSTFEHIQNITYKSNLISQNHTIIKIFYKYGILSPFLRYVECHKNTMCLCSAKKFTHFVWVCELHQIMILEAHVLSESIQILIFKRKIK